MKKDPATQLDFLDEVMKVGLLSSSNQDREIPN